MRSVLVTGPGETTVVDVDAPTAGPRDVLVRVRACGICGSDHMYTTYGGIPPRQGATPLGHEPAGEVVEVGAEIEGVAVGDHVVINVMATIDGLLGSGGAQGALSEYVVLLDAKPGEQFRVVPPHVPFAVAALNEPMAVARHAVNRLDPAPEHRVAIFGAGPIGLGALLSLKRRGVAHVVVIDIVPNRLEKALALGADAVIDSRTEDVPARLIELHGRSTGIGLRGERSSTEGYIDAAGAPQVIQTVLGVAGKRAVLSVVAVHKAPVEIDLGGLLTTELDIRLSMGYPTEIFEVTDDIIDNWQKYAQIISDEIPFERVQEALTLAATPGQAEKVVVTFGGEND
ncbi:zinc-binding dehydrogenase [Microbacterium sp. NPDC090225]|uniref:zinc-dependent alcohol dehydrogenase n=1 Tax=Microbacterium sp. NPDC090225 TaxID=3364207 RepID=UPI0038304D40